MSLVVSYYETLPDRRVTHSVEPGYLRALLPSSAPQYGESWSQIQPDIERIIMPGITHWQHPKFMAFFPCNSSFPAMLGDMYSGAINAAGFNWASSPAVTELESVMMDWIAKLIALPKHFLSNGEGGGIIQGTASEVILTAMVAARERFVRRRLKHLPEGEEKLRKAAEIRGRLVALGSEQAHSSTQKAAVIAGTRFLAISAPKETKFSVTAAALRQKLEGLRAAGLEPFYFTATLGSTATCAIDDLEGIAQITEEFPDLWIHVDAAYAGSALLCPEYQQLCRPLAYFDSFNFNLHKWLLVNFDCSAFFVKRRSDLIDTYSITPSYLRNSFTDSGLVTDYRDWEIPLGHRFRSLKVWFVLRTYGIAGLQAFIRKHIKLGDYFHRLLESRPDVFSIFTKPVFGLVTFQIKPPHLAKFQLELEDDASHLQELNSATENVYEKITAVGEFALTSALVGDVFLIRVVTATPMLEEMHLDKLFNAIVEIARGGSEVGS